MFRKDNIKVLVGDFVKITILDEEKSECVIEELFDRKTELIRPKVSNVTQVVIVFSFKNPKINYDLLDRFIVLAEEASLEIVLCINKIDLVSSEEIAKFEDIYSKIYKVITVSTLTEKSLDDLKSVLNHHTTVFAGPSGVGKSSIVNKLLNKDVMETGFVSKKIGRGKHTTRHSEFIPFNNGYIVDTPGFTSLDLSHIDKEDLKLYYKEFEEYNNSCKYNNCVHINEPQCKVKDELGQSINEKRYKSYVAFYEE